MNVRLNFPVAVLGKTQASGARFGGKSQQSSGAVSSGQRESASEAIAEVSSEPLRPTVMANNTMSYSTHVSTAAMANEVVT
jgi:hypothetical protein